MIFQQSATSVGALVADLCVQGVWIFQAEMLFNIHVVDTDAQSYCHHTPMAVLSTAEHYKKQYSQACQDHRATSTPICVIVDGMLGCEAIAVLKWIGDMSAKCEVDYGTLIGWVHARLSFAIFCATLLCVRGSCTKWRALGLVDGASMYCYLLVLFLFCFSILIHMGFLVCDCCLLLSGFVI